MSVACTAGDSTGTRGPPTQLFGGYLALMNRRGGSWIEKRGFFHCAARVIVASPGPTE